MIHASHLIRVRLEMVLLWRLAWPILIGQLATVGMSVVDVAMAGHASPQDLAGVSLGASIWFIALVTATGIMMAVGPVISHHVGARDRHMVPSVVRQALWKGLVVGLAMALLANCATLVFDHLKLEPVVRDIAKNFVHVISLAFPAAALYRVLYSYSASINKTKPLMGIALVALLLNIAINWLVVFGHLGFPKLGGIGCAWSTMACMWFNLIGLLWWIHRDPAYQSTWPFGAFERPDWPAITALLRLGLPIGATYFAETSAFCLISLLIAEFGSIQVAANQIALNVASLVFMLPLSLGIAISIRVGQSLGASDPEAARFRSWVGVAAALGCAMLSAILIGLFNRQIAAAYSSDATVVLLAAQLLTYAAFFQLSDAAQAAISFAVRGYKITRAPMVIHLGAFWLVSIPLGYALGLAPEWLPWRPKHPWAASGFWIGLIAGLTVAALGLALLLQKVSRMRVKDRTTGPTAFASLSDSSASQQA